MSGVGAQIDGSVASAVGFAQPVAQFINGMIQSSTAQATGATAALTTTPVDVPGCILSFTPSGASAFVIITAIWDMNKTDTTSAQSIGKILVDGVTWPGNAPSSWAGVGATYIDRQSLAYTYLIPLSGGTTHVIKMQAAKGATGAGVIICQQGGSVMTGILFDVP